MLCVTTDERTLSLPQYFLLINLPASRGLSLQCIMGSGIGSGIVKRKLRTDSVARPSALHTGAAGRSGEGGRREFVFQLGLIEENVEMELEQERMFASNEHFHAYVAI